MPYDGAAAARLYRAHDKGLLIGFAIAQLVWSLSVIGYGIKFRFLLVWRSLLLASLDAPCRKAWSQS